MTRLRSGRTILLRAVNHKCFGKTNAPRCGLSVFMVVSRDVSNSSLENSIF
ncbi:MAG: hypothetical protein ABIP06_10690 [Pyrinomonadaceae bacterium]